MRVAAVDLGTNSTRLLVVDSERGEVLREAHVTGLGRGVDATGRLDPECLAATVDVVARFAERMEELDVRRIAAVATSASRDAENGDELLDRVEAFLGTRPSIIPGPEEAALSFAGATGAAAPASSTLVIDIGGGSTEFVFGAAEPGYALSVDIGSVRLTERMLANRPASSAEVEAARREVDRLLGYVALPSVPSSVLGVAGTFTSLAAMDQDLTVYDRSAVEGWSLRGSAITELIRRLSSLTIEQTEEIPSLDPKRAPVILAGAIIAERSLRVAGVAWVTVTEHDLLDGLVTHLIAG